MPSKAETVEQYINELPEDRRQIISQIRNVILKNLPKGFKEGIGYGMIGYVVPHTLFPKGYHCDPNQPLPFMSLGAQKNHVALHHLGLYASETLLHWFQDEWKKSTDKKLDMGKGCIRFKKAEDVPLELIGKLVARITPGEWMEQYEQVLLNRKK